jgi:hypothetical protein
VPVLLKKLKFVALSDSGTRTYIGKGSKKVPFERLDRTD